MSTWATVNSKTANRKLKRPCIICNKALAENEGELTTDRSKGYGRIGLACQDCREVMHNGTVSVSSSNS